LSRCKKRKEGRVPCICAAGRGEERLSGKVKNLRLRERKACGKCASKERKYYPTDLSEKESAKGGENATPIWAGALLPGSCRKRPRAVGTSQKTRKGDRDVFGFNEKKNVPSGASQETPRAGSVRKGETRKKENWFVTQLSPDAEKSGRERKLEKKKRREGRSSASRQRERIIIVEKEKVSAPRMPGEKKKTGKREAIQCSLSCRWQKPREGKQRETERMIAHRGQKKRGLMGRGRGGRRTAGKKRGTRHDLPPKEKRQVNSTWRKGHHPVFEGGGKGKRTTENRWRSSFGKKAYDGGGRSRGGGEKRDRMDAGLIG